MLYWKGLIMKMRELTDTVLGSELTLPASQQPRNARESLRRKLVSLLEATVKESDLPVGIRSLIVEEFLEMKRELAERRPSFLAAERRLNFLIEEADTFKRLAPRSEVYRALAALRAEFLAMRLVAQARERALYAVSAGA